MPLPKFVKKFLIVLIFTFLYCCNSFAGDWKIKNKWKVSCGIADKKSFLKPGKKYRFKADINYQKKAKNLSVKYYLDEELIAQHLEVPLSKKKTDGPYGPSKPYIKIGIYRIGETGTTSFAYNNLIIKNKKK
jgi:hypothetical protein